MMDLPAELVYQHIIAPGGAFRTRIEEGAKYRYHFVLNQNPQDDRVILLATATSKIAEHKSKYPGDVLVEISPSEYEPLEQKSLVNCEFARAYSRADLETRLGKALAKRELEILDPLPEAILGRLRNALAESTNVAPIDKQLALGEDLV